ncbi:asparaginase [Devosia aurantiaca]|uniref:Asparaginase n=1 Tax=Devosia aurantiaca TaxID=2714858 RepID=A0A6M1SG54_9HYPH|nr:asparaginase [Devosia aurantiaca]NGP18829.1 asparaginase [Devosia aurantiaca]
MKRIVIVATGGTIASGRAQDQSVIADRKGAALLATLHDPLEGIAVEVDDFTALGSYALDLQTLHRLILRVASHLERSDCDGVVVTHGTDTMEESAFVSDLLIGSDKPVVFTGAQRHADMVDTDGPRNIADAVRVAASPQTVGLGTLVVFEGDIHAAATVTKTHASRVDTFRSPGYGKLGFIDQQTVFIGRRSARRCIDNHGLAEGIELVKPGLGSSPDYLEYCATKNVSGVVLEAFGRGNAPKGFAAAVAKLVGSSIPVVIASRCPEGRTDQIYGGDSGAVTLKAAGGIFAGELSAIKSRLLLSGLIAGKATQNEIANSFSMF